MKNQDKLISQSRNEVVEFCGRMEQSFKSILFPECENTVLDEWEYCALMA